MCDDACDVPVPPSFGHSRTPHTIAPTDAEITSLYAEVARFSLVSHFYWVIWALVQAAVSDIDFDYMAYAVLRLSEYHRRKAIVARIPGK